VNWQAGGGGTDPFRKAEDEVRAMVGAPWWPTAAPQQRAEAISSRMLSGGAEWWLFGAWGRWYRCGLDGQWQPCPPPADPAVRRGAMPAPPGAGNPPVLPGMIPTGPDLSVGRVAWAGLLAAAPDEGVTARLGQALITALSVNPAQFALNDPLFAPGTPSTLAAAWGALLWSSGAPAVLGDHPLVRPFADYLRVPREHIRWLVAPGLAQLSSYYAERLMAGDAHGATHMLRVIGEISAALQGEPRFRPGADALASIAGHSLQMVQSDMATARYGPAAIAQEWQRRCPAEHAMTIVREVAPGEYLRLALYDLAEIVTGITGQAGSPTDVKRAGVAVLAADLQTAPHVLPAVVPWLDADGARTLQEVLTQPNHPLRSLWPREGRLPDALHAAEPAQTEALLATTYAIDLAWCRLAGLNPPVPGFTVPAAAAARLSEPAASAVPSATGGLTPWQIIDAARAHLASERAHQQHAEPEPAPEPEPDVTSADPEQAPAGGILHEPGLQPPVAGKRPSPETPRDPQRPAEPAARQQPGLDPNESPSPYGDPSPPSPANPYGPDQPAPPDRAASPDGADPAYGDQAGRMAPDHGGDQAGAGAYEAGGRAPHGGPGAHAASPRAGAYEGGQPEARGPLGRAAAEEGGSPYADAAERGGSPYADAGGRSPYGGAAGPGGPYGGAGDQGGARYGEAAGPAAAFGEQGVPAYGGPGSPYGGAGERGGSPYRGGQDAGSPYGGDAGQAAAGGGAAAPGLSGLPPLAGAGDPEATQAAEADFDEPAPTRRQAMPPGRRAGDGPPPAWPPARPAGEAGAGGIVSPGPDGPPIVAAYGMRFLCGPDDVAQLLTEVRRRAQWAKGLQDQGQETSSAAAPAIVLLGAASTGQRRLTRMVAKALAEAGIGSGEIHGLSAREAAERSPAGFRALLGEHAGHTVLLEGMDELLLDPGHGEQFAAALYRTRAEGVSETTLVATCAPDRFAQVSAAHPELATDFRPVRLPDLTDPAARAVLLELLAEERSLNLSPQARATARRDLGRLRGRGRLTGARLIEAYLDRAATRHFGTAEATQMAGPGGLLLSPQDFAGVAEELEPALREVKDLAGYRAELRALTGLARVKDGVERMVAEAQVSAARKNAGLPVGDTLRHLAFAGGPGTGKSTVARLLGRMMAAVGLLESGQLVECTPPELAGPGGPVAAVRARTGEAHGGVLLVDRAGTLGEPNARAVLAELVRAMDDQRGKLLVICADRPAAMRELVDNVPSLGHRFGEVIDFPELTDHDLAAIFQSAAAERQYVLDDALLAVLPGRMRVLRAAPDFAGGHSARRLFEETVAQQSLRIVRDGRTMSAAQLTRLTAQDLPA